MPNHVKNVLKFKNLKEEDKRFLLDTICSPIEDASGGVTLCIDFDKIIPEPRFESECPDEFKVNKDSHVEVDKDRPWFDWYKWRNFYWDTKWGAYDCYSKVGKSYVIFVYSTAWSTSVPIIDKLTLLGFDFELRYADEDYGSNCGRMVYSSEQGLDAYGESSFKNPSQWARNLWNRY